MFLNESLDLGARNPKPSLRPTLDCAFLAAKMCGKYMEHNRLFSALQGVSITDDFMSVIVTRNI
jgi:hypothetical protein